MKIKTDKITDIRQFCIDELSEIYQPNESVIILDMIFVDFFGLSRTERVLNPGKRMTESEIQKIDFALHELKKHKPIQYILKNSEFYGLSFYVDENVLIPRAETEELVEWIILESSGDAANASILDIGTGSGCIAIALKKNLMPANVWAMEISVEALAVATKNAETNNVGINFLLHDILDEKSPENLPQFDLIVSNPPYVRTSEKLLMKKNVLDNEPSLALFVDDEDPLKFYHAIANFSLNHLKSGGVLFLEINENLSLETARLLTSKGFSSIIIKKDLNDKNRMIKAIKT